MRNLVLSTILLSAAIRSQAQSFTEARTAPSPVSTAAESIPPTGWARVQVLTPNTALHIAARTHNAHCRLQSTDAETLTCLAGGKSETFQRADIKSIKVPHRTRSTVVGLAAGAGIGAAIGAAAGKTDGILGRGAFAAIFAVPLGLIGAIIGAATDFTSSTIYRA